jgi:hypothetical protein
MFCFVVCFIYVFSFALLFLFIDLDRCSKVFSFLPSGRRWYVKKGANALYIFFYHLVFFFSYFQLLSCLLCFSVEIKTVF